MKKGEKTSARPRHKRRNLAPDIDRALGQKLREARVERGWSQGDLATRVNLSHQQIQKYETGVNRVCVSTLYALAEVLEVPVAALLPEHGVTNPLPHGGANQVLLHVVRHLEQLPDDIRKSFAATIRAVNKAYRGETEAGDD